MQVVDSLKVGCVNRMKLLDCPQCDNREIIDDFPYIKKPDDFPKDEPTGYCIDCGFYAPLSRFGVNKLC